MDPIELSVFSETDRLRHVVVHAPGPEVDLMVPAMMESLLFDDILAGDLAREEHALFRHVLGRVAEEVLDIQELFQEALGEEGIKQAFIQDLQRLVDLPDRTCEILREMPPRHAAQSIITGIPWPDAQVSTHWQRDFDYRLRPIPNLLFMRDPASVIGHGYSIHVMATWARAREPLILSYVFRHHPRLRHLPPQARLFDQVTPLLRDEIRTPMSLEGGDILVLSDKVLVMGCSQRTSVDAIHQLAERLQEARQHQTATFDWIIMVLLPRSRSAMHLDTVFTRVSQEECLVYPPYFTDGSRELLNTITFDLRHGELRTHTTPNLLKALRDVDIPLAPISCGGHHLITQQREQWTDGANAFCLAPGVVLLYARNPATAMEFRKAGYRTITTRELLAQPSLDLLDGRRYAILLESAELGRARGGPRCMTLPLSRRA